MVLLGLIIIAVVLMALTVLGAPGIHWKLPRGSHQIAGRACVQMRHVRGYVLDRSCSMHHGDGHARRMAFDDRDGALSGYLAGNQDPQVPADEPFEADHGSRCLPA